MHFLIASFCLILLTGCGDPQVSAKGGPDRVEHGATQPFDALTLRLELEATSVQSGDEIESTLVVQNRSGKTITDPACLIAAGRYALVGVDDPEAELWLAPVVDCQGAFDMPDGFIESNTGPTFPARTKYGDPLPPGRYIASLQIEGRSDRLEQPVDVTE